MGKEEFALQVVSEYINKNGVNVPVEVHFVDSINDCWIHYTNNPKVIFAYTKQDFSNYNGLMLPFDGSKYHILIRNDYADYECTIIHESTHVIDYEKFRLLFNNGNLDIETNIHYWSMSLYSEFHARKSAHKYYIEYLLPDADKIEVIFREMFLIVSEVREIENQIRVAADSDIIRGLLYELMQHLGRIYAIKLDISQLDDYSDNIKNLYSSLIGLDENWNDEAFEAVEKALKKLFK